MCLSCFLVFASDLFNAFGVPFDALFWFRANALLVVLAASMCFLASRIFACLCFPMSVFDLLLFAFLCCSLLGGSCAFLCIVLVGCLLLDRVFVRVLCPVFSGTFFVFSSCLSVFMFSF